MIDDREQQENPTLQYKVQRLLDSPVNTHLRRAAASTQAIRRLRAGNTPPTECANDDAIVLRAVGAK